MSYTVLYSPAAREDLENLWDVVFSISQDRNVADKYLDGVLSAIEAKKEFPRSGSPLVYRGLFTGFYSVLFKKYLAFYRVRENRIEVARVILATADYLKTLFGNADEDDPS